VAGAAAIARGRRLLSDVRDGDWVGQVIGGERDLGGRWVALLRVRRQRDMSGWVRPSRSISWPSCREAWALHGQHAHVGAERGSLEASLRSGRLACRVW